jgi:hypothetical protein
MTNHDVISVLQTNLVIATMSNQLDLIDSAKDGFYKSFFAVCLPLLGVVAGPLGVVIDK